MKKIFIAILLISSLSSGAQQIAGYWYGTANPDYGTSNNYLIELILNQKQTSVSGIIKFLIFYWIILRPGVTRHLVPEINMKY